MFADRSPSSEFDGCAKGAWVDVGGEGMVTAQAWIRWGTLLNASGKCLTAFHEPQFPTSKWGRILELSGFLERLKIVKIKNNVPREVFRRLVNSSHQYLADKILDEFYFSLSSPQFEAVFCF